MSFWHPEEDIARDEKITALEAQVQELQNQLSALGNVISEFTGTAALKGQIDTRFEVLENDLSEVELRLTMRVESLEDTVSGQGDTSSKEKESASGGYIPWSERKRRAVAKEADPSVWIKASTAKKGTAEPVKE